MLIAATLGGLYFGIVTTTEAAVIGCVLSIVLGSTSASSIFRASFVHMQTRLFHRQHPVPDPRRLYLLGGVELGGVGEKVTAFIVDLQLSKLEFYLARS